MVKTVFLEIGTGNFDQGFDAWLQIWQENGLPKTARIQGRLPYNEQLRYMLVAWSESFRILAEDARQFSRTSQVSDIYGVDSVVENESLTEGSTACLKLLQSLEEETNNWLNKIIDRDWLRIREIIREEFAQTPNTTRLVIQSQESFIWKLPWYSWDLLKRYRNVGVSFCTSDVYRESNIISSRTKPRILAAFGDSHNIDLEVDRKILRKLRSRGADPCFIGHIPQKLSVLGKKLSQLRTFQTRSFSKKPLTSAELISQLRNKKGWDIFFFAGHSWGDKIFINQEESLVVDQFKLAIGEAVSRGLKIAIFNSCNALWLARDLVDLNIPVVIVMQEALPDVVAHRFLAEFLENYSSGDFLHIAVRKAQESLEVFSDFPGSSWLPVIFCNPAYNALSWPVFNKVPKRSLNLSPPQRVGTNKMLLVSMLVWLIVSGVRSAALLQDLELTSLDYLTQVRRRIHEEEADDRLFIIGIDEQDIENQGDYPITDKTILEVLKIVESHQPSIIGLDIFRDKEHSKNDSVSKSKNSSVSKSTNSNEFPSKYEQLIQHLAVSRVVPVCQYHKKSVLPGASIPEGIKPDRFGFVNFPDQLFNIFNSKYDETIIRRYALTKDGGDEYECKTKNSLALMLFGNYLANQHHIKISGDGNHIWMGKVKLRSLTANQSGGYQQSFFYGNQFLINYRASKQVARQVSLSDILSTKFKPSWIKNKIVLIGYTFTDLHFTPYSRKLEDEREAGVIIHAHVISQFLSHILDGRPLLSAPSYYVESAWIWVWSLLGSMIAWIYLGQFVRTLILTLCAFLLNILICYFAFLRGIWMPFIPTFIAYLLATWSFILLVNILFRYRNRNVASPDYSE